MRCIIALTFGMVIIAITLMPLDSQGVTAQKPSFEGASIKQYIFPSDASFMGYSAVGSCNRVTPAISGNRVTLSRVSLCGLISTAYDLPDYRISADSNDWIKKQDRSLVYEVHANAPDAAGPLTAEHAREMLQQLLADRFQLKVHSEMKQLSVYALVVGKNGPKLTLRDQGPCSTANPNAALTFNMSISLAGIVKPGGELASCKPQMTMARLAQSLTRYTDRPIVDQTELEGGQVFELRWGSENESDPSPSLFTAIQEQLGLRLDATKATLEVLVIDHVQRPTEN
jgi:uncharacterized protein (TIGR03435 family)